jgi:hypothetical protein
MSIIIKDNKLTRISGIVKPDAKRRVVLPATALAGKEIVYHVYTNLAGQIILDPQVTISASEAWLFENGAALSSIDRGMAESNNGQAIDRGSFAKFVKDEM